MKRWLAIGTSLCAVCAMTPDAFAEPMTHDGFYAQLTGGLGYLSTSAEQAGAEISISGLAIDSSIALGGSIMPGLAIGGMILLDYAPSPGFDPEPPIELDISQFLIGIGPMVDFYPDPAGGLHIQGMVGWGGLETSSEGNVGGSDPTGLVLSIGAGYDFFLSDELSAGVLGKFAYGALSLNDVGYSTISPGIAATLTYH